MRTLGLIRWILLPAAICLCAAFFFARESAAQEDPIERFSLSGQFGAGGLAMGSVNTRIRDGNRAVLRPYDKEEVSQLRYGFNFTGDLRARLSHSLSVSVGGGLITGKTGVDYDYVITVEPKATFLYIRGMYQLPYRPIRNLILRVGGGPLYLSSAELSASHEFRTVDGGTRRLESLTFEGEGWGAQGWFEGELVVSERFTIVGDLGYRRAVVSRGEYDWSVSDLRCPLCPVGNTEIPEMYSFDTHSFLSNSFLEIIENEDGNPRTDDIGRTLTEPRFHWKNMDFSGVQANVGLRVYLF